MLKRLLGIVISLIVTAAFFAIFHLLYLLDLFRMNRIVPFYVPAVISIVLGLIFYFLFSSAVTNKIMTQIARTEERLVKMNLKELSFSLLGCIIGLAIANLIGIAFNGFGPLGTGIIILLNIVLGFLGFRVARKKKDEINVSNLKNVLANPDSKKNIVAYGRPKILDTSVIIDGRILDLLQTGFIEGKILIPNFVLEELRHIADSSDSLKRNRGRRGLDILNEIQKQLSVPVEIVDYDTKEALEVDSKLLKMGTIA